MTCQHDLAERETDCADGACSICLQVKNAALRAALQTALDAMNGAAMNGITPRQTDAIRAALAKERAS